MLPEPCLCQHGGRAQHAAGSRNQRAERRSPDTAHHVLNGENWARRDADEKCLGTRLKLNSRSSPLDGLAFFSRCVPKDSRAQVESPKTIYM